MGLLSNLCNLLSDQQNLYAMRCLYRVVQLSKDKLIGFSKDLGPVLKKFIDDIAKDEKDLSQNYVYILFETAALSLKFLNGKEEMT